MGTVRRRPPGRTDTGSTINALGFQNGDPKQGNTITVSSGTLVVGALGSGAGTPPFLRANVFLAGGNIASTNGINAQYGGSFTVAATTTSKVAGRALTLQTCW